MKTVYWTISIVLLIYIILGITQHRAVDYGSVIAFSVNFWGYHILLAIKEKAIVNVSLKDYEGLS